jgi:hypothetical protein
MPENGAHPNRMNIMNLIRYFQQTRMKAGIIMTGE